MEEAHKLVNIARSLQVLHLPTHSPFFIWKFGDHADHISCGRRTHYCYKVEIDLRTYESCFMHIVFDHHMVPSFIDVLLSPPPAQQTQHVLSWTGYIDPDWHDRWIISNISFSCIKCFIHDRSRTLISYFSLSSSFVCAYTGRQFLVLIATSSIF